MSVDMTGRREVDLAVPIHQLPLWVLALGLALFIIPVLLYGVFHVIEVGDFLTLGTIVWLLVFTVAHELIHAIGWKFASGLPWNQFSFGIDWKTLSPYCHAKAPMDMMAYRIGGGAPLVVVGIIPYVYALLTGNAWLAGVMAIMISASVGDVFVLWTLRNLPPGTTVLDHPSKAGCIAYVVDNTPQV